MRIEKEGMYFQYKVGRFLPIRSNQDENRCCICDYGLDAGFQFIVYKLRKAGLLADNFHPLCCYCGWVKTLAVENGFGLGKYEVNIERTRKRWIEHFPHLNIKIAKKSNFRGGSVFLHHQRDNLCNSCSREGCITFLQDRARNRGACAGYAPNEEAFGIMERVEEFNNAIDERAERQDIFGQNNNDGVEMTLDVVGSIEEWLEGIPEVHRIQVVDFSTYYPNFHPENNEENDNKD